MERTGSWFIVLIIVILSISILLTQLSAQAATDKTPPTVKILSPPSSSILPPGIVPIQGSATDKGSGVKLVQVKIDSGAFSNAVPKSINDWSSWTLLQNIPTTGSHKIEAKATDFAGNQKSNSITITIQEPPDTVPPTITPPPNVIAEATGVLTSVNLGAATATDNKDTSPSIINNAPTLFQLGTTIVKWTATDSSGNTASADQTVTIIDTTSPSVIAPDNIVLVSSNDFSTVDLGTPVTSDLVDSSPAVTNNAPAIFPIGTTQIVWTVTDFSGNSASALQTVTINESTTDSFGIDKIFPSKIGGPKWQMNNQDILNDSQFSTIPPPSSTCSTPLTCTLLYQNTPENDWRAARVNVPVNEGIRLVVQSPPDNLWLNTEMTGYYKLESSIYYPQEFVHVLRSGSPHSTTCQGYSYYAGISFDGNVAKIQKSLYHGGDKLGYSQTFYIKGVTTPLDNRWIGMKTITYNINDNTAVKIEIWLDDLADNNWRKVYEQVDNGWSVPGDPSSFGCINPLTGLPRSSNDIILWGGTEQQFRADNSEIDFKSLSIREIIPPQN